jgi:hypothetical protein
MQAWMYFASKEILLVVEALQAWHFENYGTELTMYAECSSVKWLA